MTLINPLRLHGTADMSSQSDSIGVCKGISWAISLMAALFHKRVQPCSIVIVMRKLSSRVVQE